MNIYRSFVSAAGLLAINYENAQKRRDWLVLGGQGDNSDDNWSEGFDTIEATMNSEEEVGRLAVMKAREHKIFCNDQAADDSVGTGAIALKRKDDIQDSSVIKSSTRGKEKMGEARVKEAMMMLNKEDNTAPFCNTSQYPIVSIEETDIPLKSLLDNPGAISGNKANKKVRCWKRVSPY
ncbi:hypothetical protein TorRG33x02_145670 [Trema orientale]|uniref:Uncharacterized protein n=1 Tax=Trema orientale TaxID=63057 RepID=A0A2P5EVQ0_TREOI|nr:hypothetical protein TorRG33x02_145670 [Trema orientale]